MTRLATWLCPTGLSAIGRGYTERGNIILNQVEYIDELTQRRLQQAADIAALDEQVVRRDAQIADMRDQIDRINETMCGMSLLVRDADNNVSELIAERDRLLAERGDQHRAWIADAVRADDRHQEALREIERLNALLAEAQTDAEKYRAYRAKDRARLQSRRATRAAA